MWTSTHEGRSAAAPATVHALMADVTTWPRWNAGVDHIDLDGPFRPGASARMFFPGGEVLPFTITRVEDGRGYEDLTDVPDAGVVVRVRHDLVPDGTGTVIRYTCEVDGESQEACAGVGEQVTADFDEVIAALAALAEQ